MKIKIRCSSLGLIMTAPKGKGEILSVGAKTYVDDLAKQHVYGYTKSVSTREMQKGLVVEPDSIALLNDVLFSSYVKNAERKENEWIGGTCDIFTGSKIHDIKSSWSLDTFPALPEDGDKSLYEWQQRGYMMLWDVNEAELDYCLVDTPDELIGFDDESAHRVAHIDSLLRVTRVHYKRDADLEKLIVTKTEAAQAYFVESVQAIMEAHR